MALRSMKTSCIQHCKQASVYKPRYTSLGIQASVEQDKVEGITDVYKPRLSSPDYKPCVQASVEQDKVKSITELCTSLG
jgi:hypothetical protein